MGQNGPDFLEHAIDFANSITTGSMVDLYIWLYNGDLDGQINSGYNDAFISKYFSDGTKLTLFEHAIMILLTQ